MFLNCNKMLFSVFTFGMNFLLLFGGHLVTNNYPNINKVKLHPNDASRATRASILNNHFTLTMNNHTERNPSQKRQRKQFLHREQTYHNAVCIMSKGHNSRLLLLHNTQLFSVRTYNPQLNATTSEKSRTLQDNAAGQKVDFSFKYFKFYILGKCNFLAKSQIRRCHLLQGKCDATASSQATCGEHRWRTQVAKQAISPAFSLCAKLS